LKFQTLDGHSVQNRIPIIEVLHLLRWKMCQSCLASFGVVEINTQLGDDKIILLINSFDCFREQNFFKDFPSWNTFDFITVIGSIVDVFMTEFLVCKASEGSRKKEYKCVNCVLVTEIRNRNLPGIYTYNRESSLKNLKLYCDYDSCSGEKSFGWSRVKCQNWSFMLIFYVDANDDCIINKLDEKLHFDIFDVGQV